MSENNNQPHTLSDVALDRVMRDVLGTWEPSPRPCGQPPDTAANTQDLPDEDPEGSC